MRWPWSKPPNPATAVRCPMCGETGPFFRSTELTSYWIVDGKVVEVVTGYRVHGQRCEHTFSISDAGTFRHSRKVLPFTPEYEPRMEKPQIPASDDDGPPLPGVPRPKPPI